MGSAKPLMDAVLGTEGYADQLSMAKLRDLAAARPTTVAKRETTCKCIGFDV